MASKLNFGIHDLFTPRNCIVKKYLMMLKLSEKFKPRQIYPQFGYKNSQSYHHAIREVKGWLKVDAEVQKMWEAIK